MSRGLGDVYKRQYYDKILMPKDSKLRRSVVITNPLGEDTSVMRTTALPSILEILAKNYNNRNEKAYLYELAREYIPTTDDKLPVEKNKLIGGFYGLSDFFELKGIVEETLDRLSIYDYDVEASADEFAYHPGRCAVLTIDGERIGVFGELHPQVAENYGIVERVYAFELEADLLFKYTKSEKQYTPLPQFPAVTRDIAVICDENIPVLTLEKAMKKSAGSTLESVKLFDVYQGEQIEKGKKLSLIHI
mgnify:FL=1